MLNSTILEVAIGMAFVYLLLSLFCTAIREAIAGLLKSRAKNLEKGIESLFTEGLKTLATKDSSGKDVPPLTLTDAIYQHGLVQSLYRSGSGIAKDIQSGKIDLKPSYIPASTFASALFDIVFPVDLTATPPGPPKGMDAMLAKLKELPEGKGKQAITTLVVQAEGDIKKTREAFEKWYDDGMDRAAGWYKKNTQAYLFIIGLFAAIFLNVDSISVATKLWTTPALRTYAVGVADQYAKKHPLRAEPKSSTPSVTTSPTAGTAPDSGKTDDCSLQAPPSQGASGGQQPDPNEKVSAACAEKELDELQTQGLPIGWKGTLPSWLKDWDKNKKPIENLPSVIRHWEGFLLSVFGWLLTAIAMTLGASFWFDTLNKFMVVRSTIKPGEKSGPGGSK